MSGSDIFVAVICVIAGSGFTYFNFIMPKQQKKHDDDNNQK